MSRRVVRACVVVRLRVAERRLLRRAADRGKAISRECGKEDRYGEGTNIKK